MCILFILMTSSVVLFVSSFRHQNSVRYIAENKMKISAIGSEKFEYSIDSIKEEYDSVMIRGWAVQKGLQYPYYNYGMDESGLGVYNKFYLGCLERKQIILFPMKLEKSAEANEAMNDGINYQYCGFVATVPKKYFTLAQENGFLFCFCNPDGNWEAYNAVIGETDE